MSRTIIMKNPIIKRTELLTLAKKYLTAPPKVIDDFLEDLIQLYIKYLFEDSSVYKIRLQLDTLRKENKRLKMLNSNLCRRKINEVT